MIQEATSITNPSSYLLRFGDRVATVVGEARCVALLRGVNNLVAAQRHEVVMLVLVEFTRATSELLLIQHLAHILDDEVATE